MAPRLRKESSSSVTKSELLRKLEQQQYRCALSGEPMTPSLSSLDHINPKAIGGEDGIGNLQIVLPCVNRAKGTMTQSQFVAMCHAISRSTPDSGDTSWVEFTGITGKPAGSSLARG